jgi:hypothetical protein
LAVFSVRSAYNLIRQASSTLSQYNEKYAADLEYIKYAIAQTLAPLLQYLVNLAYKLLTYINYIASAWFNINLFGKASAKSFQSMKNSASSTAKSAKEIKNSLAGFDEMNILSDNTTSSSGTSGGAVAPSVDLSSLDVEIPKWLQWIADNKDLILDFFEVLGSAIAGIKLGDLLYNLGLIGEKLSFIQKLGIAMMIYEVIQFIKDIISYFSKLDGSLENNGTNWEDFGKIIVDIGLFLSGLALAIASIPLAITAAVITILGILAENWDTVKGWLENAEDFITGLITKVQEWFIKNIDSIQEKFGWLGVGIMGTITALVSWILEIVKGVISMVKNLLNGLFTGVKQILDGILLIIKGNFKQGITSIIKGIANVVIGILNSLISGINAILYPIRELIAGLGSVMGKSWSIDTVKIPTITYLKTGGIINMPRKRNTNWRCDSTANQEESGVIPLTDSQAMQELGESIGKYITINANIVNSMNGRVISRQLQQIQANQDFAYNT